MADSTDERIAAMTKAVLDAGALPDDNPKTVHGVAKPALHAIPPVALLWLGEVMRNGAAKYGLTNWREAAVTDTVYYDAMLRHLFAWLDGEERDPESGLPHLAHVMAGAAILLDAEAQQTLIRGRSSFPGKAARLIAERTKATAR